MDRRFFKMKTRQNNSLEAENSIFCSFVFTEWGCPHWFIFFEGHHFHLFRWDELQINKAAKYLKLFLFGVKFLNLHTTNTGWLKCHLLKEKTNKQKYFLLLLFATSIEIDFWPRLLLALKTLAHTLTLHTFTNTHTHTNTHYHIQTHTSNTHKHIQTHTSNTHI